MVLNSSTKHPHVGFFVYLDYLIPEKLSAAESECNGLSGNRGGSRRKRERVTRIERQQTNCFPEFWKGKILALRRSDISSLGHNSDNTENLFFYVTLLKGRRDPFYFALFPFYKIFTMYVSGIHNFHFLPFYHWEKFTYIHRKSSQFYFTRKSKIT